MKMYKRRYIISFVIVQNQAKLSYALVNQVVVYFLARLDEAGGLDLKEDTTDILVVNNELSYRLGYIIMLSMGKCIKKCSLMTCDCVE